MEKKCEALRFKESTLIKNKCPNIIIIILESHHIGVDCAFYSNNCKNLLPVHYTLLYYDKKPRTQVHIKCQSPITTERNNGWCYFVTLICDIKETCDF